MPRLLATATAHPPHTLSQDAAREFARVHFARASVDVERSLGIFDNAGIRQRQICQPVEWYMSPRTFSEKNRAFIEWAERLGARAASECLQRAGVRPEEVDHLIFVSTTGLATPSLDARLISRLGLGPHTRRTPIVGLGCAGGAAGLAHAARSARAEPDQVVLLVAVETTSLTFLHEDLSKSNLVATALFGDGAAAAVVAGERVAAAGPELCAERTTLFPDSLDLMGWHLLDAGLQVVFSRAIPSLVRRLARADVEDFLAAEGLDRGDVGCWIVHPGGRRVIEAYAEALELSPEALEATRGVLRDHGNMSSATVLYVLDRLFHGGRPRSGEVALLTALGPGFSSEKLLLRGARE